MRGTRGRLLAPHAASGKLGWLTNLALGGAHTHSSEPTQPRARSRVVHGTYIRTHDACGLSTVFFQVLCGPHPCARLRFQTYYC